MILFTLFICNSSYNPFAGEICNNIEHRLYLYRIYIGWILCIINKSHKKSAISEFEFIVASTSTTNLLEFFAFFSLCTFVISEIFCELFECCSICFWIVSYRIKLQSTNVSVSVYVWLLDLYIRYGISVSVSSCGVCRYLCAKRRVRACVFNKNVLLREYKLVMIFIKSEFEM